MGGNPSCDIPDCPHTAKYITRDGRSLCIQHYIDDLPPEEQDAAWAEWADHPAVLRMYGRD